MELSVNMKNTHLNAGAPSLDGGYIRMYSGLKPAAVADPITDQALLAELRFSSPAFGPAVNGQIFALPMTKDSNAKSTGQATWFRAFSSNGATAQLQGTVVPKGSGADIELSNINIQIHGTVSLDEFKHSIT